MEGAISCKWGSFASKGAAPLVRLPEITQLLDAVEGPNTRRKVEKGDEG